MEKECATIKCIETDDGYRIEITGKKMKEMMACCGMPMIKIIQGDKSDCCPPEKKE
ncbi:MAG: hypothetical protein AB1746_07050 [Candidatus Zixiibacteriota bacterium]